MNFKVFKLCKLWSLTLIEKVRRPLNHDSGIVRQLSKTSVAEDESDNDQLIINRADLRESQLTGTFFEPFTCLVFLSIWNILL